MTSARRPPGSASASYQSPPTSVPAAGQVAGREAQARHGGQALGQQRALELLGDAVLALEQPGALDRQRRAVGGDLQQRGVRRREGALEQRAHDQRAEHRALEQQRHGEDRGRRLPDELGAELLGLPDVVDDHRLALARDALEEAAGVRLERRAPDRDVDALGGLHHDVALLLLVAQDHRRVVDLQHLGDAGQQLAEQLVERQRGQRRVGDPLQGLQALRDRLGLHARGLLADEQLALALGPLALAEVLHLDEHRRLVPRARQREAQQRRHLAPARPEQALLDVVALHAAGDEALAALGVERAVVGVGQVVDGAAEQVGLVAAERVAQRPVDRHDPLALAQPGHADRRAVEGRALQRLAGAQRVVGAPQVDEDRDLGAQELRVVGLEEVVDGARGVAAEDVLALLGDRRDEDDRDVARALALLDVLGGLEAVEVGHLDVEQDHREVAVEQVAQRLGTRGGADERAVQGGERRLERDEVLRAVVDEQHRRARGRGGRGRRVSHRCPSRTCARARGRCRRAVAAGRRGTPPGPRGASRAARRPPGPARARRRRGGGWRPGRRRRRGWRRSAARRSPGRRARWRRSRTARRSTGG
jgi:hypothetical protein